MARTNLKRKSKVEEEVLNITQDESIDALVKKTTTDISPANTQQKAETRKTIGEILRTFREKQKRTPEEVSKYLNISVRYIKAIENMDISMLPERVYTLGFVRSYAHYLGIDPQKSVDHFKKEMYEDSSAKRLLLPEPVADFTRPSYKLILACVCILLALGMIWLGLNGEFNLF